MEFRKFDEHGFPIPPSFGDLRYHDDEAPVRRKVSMRAKRLVIIGLLLGIVVPAIFGPRLLGMGRETFARWLGSRAERKYQEGDSRGALEDLTWAIDWDPKSLPLYLARAQLRLELHDLEGSLADWNEFLQLLADDKTAGNHRRRRGPSRSGLMADAFSQRSWVLTRMGRHREAIDDASRAVQLLPSPRALNGRAYTRALARMELAEGLADVQQAIDDTNNPDADLLDTRGYLLHLLDRNEEALRDLNQALEIAEREKAALRQHARLRIDLRRAAHLRRQQDRALAVMYHHRGLVLERLGRNAEAATDLQRADELGYDPAGGVL